MFGLLILSLVHNLNPSTGTTVAVCLLVMEKMEESVGACLLAVLALKDGGRRMLAERR